jgi:hypothetical protein
MHSPTLDLLAAIHYTRGFDIDRLLVDVCAKVSASGIKLGGLLQISTGERGGNCAASVHVVDLRTLRAFDIWQNRGPCARGCRLDEAGLAEAEVAIREAIADRVDLLIVNRFGRAESIGRGLRACFDNAMSVNVPVLTAVRPPYDDDWRAFSAGLAVELSPSPEEICAWVAGASTRPASEWRAAVSATRLGRP